MDNQSHFNSFYKIYCGVSWITFLNKKCNFIVIYKAYNLYFIYFNITKNYNLIKKIINCK